MNKLPLGLRLTLNVLAFAVPIVVMMYLMYQSESVNIEFGQKEFIGAEMQKPYENIFRKVALAKANGGHGEVSFDDEIKSLREAHSKMAEDLQFTPEGLSSRKRELASLNSLEDLLRQKNYSEAINSIKMAIAHLGDTSNLILDPDLDSYYLMDITLLALPQLQDRLQTVLTSSDTFFTGELSVENKIQAALFAQALKESDLGRITADVQTSLNEDKNFSGVSASLQSNLPATSKELEAKVNALIEQLTSISQGTNIARDDFRKTGVAALNQSFDSWDASIKEMEALLQTRIDGLEAHRMKTMMLAGFALMLAVLFSILIGYSIKKSLNAMITSLFSLKKAAASTLEIGQDLSKTTRTVAESVNEQCEAVERTAATLEEISSMVRISTESSKKASQTAQDASNSASIGESEIIKMLGSIKDIGQSSKKISDTVGVIDDIAFQTNLLALNASVEAARAGEQGKGFAVVADAVRALAQKSAGSAKEINTMVSSSAEMIASNQRGADQAAVVLKQIVSSIQNLNTLNSEISHSAVEQSVGIEQITKAITEFGEQASKNQQSLEALTRTAQSMWEQSKQLNLVIHTLEKELTGKDAAEMPELETT